LTDARPIGPRASWFGWRSMGVAPREIFQNRAKISESCRRTLGRARYVARRWWPV